MENTIIIIFLSLHWSEEYSVQNNNRKQESLMLWSKWLQRENRLFIELGKKIYKTGNAYYRVVLYILNRVTQHAKTK